MTSPSDPLGPMEAMSGLLIEQSRSALKALDGRMRRTILEAMLRSYARLALEYESVWDVVAILRELAATIEDGAAPSARKWEPGQVEEYARMLLDVIRPQLGPLEPKSRALVLEALMVGYVRLALECQAPQRVIATLRELSQTLEDDGTAR